MVDGKPVSSRGKRENTTMKPGPITTLQLVSWLSVSAAAVILWISWPEWMGLAGGILGLSSVFLMGREEFTAPLGRRRGWTLVLGFTGIVILVIVLKRGMAESVERELFQLLQGPRLILPAWAVAVWLVYRRWKSRDVRMQGAAHPMINEKASTESTTNQGLE